MAKLKIERNDNLRVLLTEVLPYELPLTYSNEGLYDFLKTKDKFSNIPTVTKYLYETNGYTIPFDYHIKKSTDKSRKLSIIHPSAQHDFVSFYERYESLILSQCNKSSFSLRTPSSIASRYYEKDLLKIDEDDSKTPHVDSELNGFAEQSKYASSYFVYKKYNFLYKFYDSYEFHRLEKKFNYLLKFDLSKCFHSIYTHSIAWAVKDKYYAKENSSSDSFENKFDKLMQKANFNETNGIIIGPEVSRIFAEVILQHIDDQVLKSLESDGYLNNVDYRVRRYVDDYFIFSNSKSLAEKIKKSFMTELEKFKLYLNDSKTEILEVPYISDLSVAKNDIKKLFFETFEALKNHENVINGIDNDGEDDEEEDVFSIKLISYPSRLSNKIIKDIKCIIKSNNIKYESVSGYILSIIKKKIRTVTSEYTERKINNEHIDKSTFNFLYLCLDVSYFIYSMDCRVRSTYLIAQLIVILHSLKNKLPVHYLEVLEKKVFDESLLIIRKSSESKFKTVEIINLIISLKTISNEYIVPDKDLKSIFPCLNDYKQWDYFYYTTILFYIGENEIYNKIKDNVLSLIIEAFENKRNPMIDTQFICLFFDLISCPFIDDEYKKILTKIVLEKCSLSCSESNINSTVNFIKKRSWFTCWNAKDIQLAKILMKKELRSSYE